VILNSIKQHESRLKTQPKPARTWDEAQAEKPKASAAFGGGSTGAERQKNEARRLRKLEKRVRRAGDKDMASELAF
jgi:hypothetical protein